MLNFPSNHTEAQSHSPMGLTKIVKPLALMTFFFSVSPDAFAIRDCDTSEQAAAAATCALLAPVGSYGLSQCLIWGGDNTWMECCHTDDSTHCYTNVTSDGTVLPEDEDRDDPFATSATEDDDEGVVDRETEESDEGELRDEDDVDTDEDGLEAGETDEDYDTVDADEDYDTGDADEDYDTGVADDSEADEDNDTGGTEDTPEEDDTGSTDAPPSHEADSESEHSKADDSAKGCSTAGQTHGGLITLILGALMGLTRRQVRWS
jgi:hypothetical protein